MVGEEGREGGGGAGGEKWGREGEGQEGRRGEGGGGEGGRRAGRGETRGRGLLRGKRVADCAKGTEDWCASGELEGGLLGWWGAPDGLSGLCGCVE